MASGVPGILKRTVGTGEGPLVYQTAIIKSPIRKDELYKEKQTLQLWHLQNAFSAMSIQGYATAFYAEILHLLLYRNSPISPPRQSQSRIGLKAFRKKEKNLSKNIQSRL